MYPNPAVVLLCNHLFAALRAAAAACRAASKALTCDPAAATAPTTSLAEFTVYAARDAATLTNDPEMRERLNREAQTVQLAAQALRRQAEKEWRPAV